MNALVYDGWAYSSNPYVNLEEMMTLYNRNMNMYLEQCVPRSPIDQNMGKHVSIKPRMSYEQQRINYKKNYSFYDGYVNEWYNRKKVLNELQNYFETKCETEITPVNKCNDTFQIITK